MQQQRWIRFERAGKTGFGTLDGNKVREHQGDMFGEPRSRRAACSRWTSSSC